MQRSIAAKSSTPACTRFAHKLRYRVFALLLDVNRVTETD